MSARDDTIKLALEHYLKQLNWREKDFIEAYYKIHNPKKISLEKFKENRKFNNWITGVNTPRNKEIYYIAKTFDITEYEFRQTGKNLKYESDISNASSSEKKYVLNKDLVIILNYINNYPTIFKQYGTYITNYFKQMLEDNSVLILDANNIVYEFIINQELKDFFIDIYLTKDNRYHQSLNKFFLNIYQDISSTNENWNEQNYPINMTLENLIAELKDKKIYKDAKIIDNLYNTILHNCGKLYRTLTFKKSKENDIIINLLNEITKPKIYINPSDEVKNVLFKIALNYLHSTIDTINNKYLL